MTKTAILFPETRTIADLVKEYYEENKSIKYEDIDYEKAYSWINANPEISLGKFEETVISNPNKIIPFLQNIDRHLDALAFCAEGDNDIPQKWYFKHIFAIFGKTMYYDENDFVEETSGLFDKLSQKDLLSEEAIALIRTISNSSILSHIGPDIREIFAMTIDEAMSNYLFRAYNK